MNVVEWEPLKVGEFIRVKLTDVAAVPTTGISAKQDLSLDHRFHTELLAVRAVEFLRCFTLLIEVVAQSAVCHYLKTLVDLVGESDIFHCPDDRPLTGFVKDDSICASLRNASVDGRGTHCK